MIEKIPRHLLAELIEGSWLPILGAGFSRNAKVSGGKEPAAWADLGATLVKDLDGVDTSSGVLEVLSAFEHSFGRVALIDNVARLIRAHDAAPGVAHLAFARVGFSDVLTTNFDTLLERAYSATGKECLPIIEESQLSTPNRYPGPRLIKFHGDINHSDRMIVTEDDYDNFLLRHPLLATSVTALLVERTGILIGYSMDDPDTRQMLALIKQRLGREFRPLWTILFGANEATIRKFERRGVKVINLPRRRKIHLSEHYAQLFMELAQHWQDRLPDASVSTDERVTADFRLRQEPSRICLFTVPAALLGWYRDWAFPAVERAGLIPATAREMVSPPSASSAKLDTLVHRAAVVISEPGDPISEYESSVALAQKSPEAVLLVRESVSDSENLKNAGPQRFIQRPSTADDASAFVAHLEHWLASRTRPPLDRRGEPGRLLSQQLYGPALISAMTLLEQALTAALDPELRRASKPAPLRVLLREAEERGLVEHESVSNTLDEAITYRNRIVHGLNDISAGDAHRIVKGVLAFIDQLRL